jgi:hypothetical protein
LQNTAIEFFFADGAHFCYLFDFPEPAIREQAFQAIVKVKPSKLESSTYSRSSKSPASQLSSSNLTQRWVKREISNFEYLMYVRGVHRALTTKDVLLTEALCCSGI